MIPKYNKKGALIEWLGGTLLASLFGIAIVLFALTFAQDNNAAIDISDDPEVSNFYGNTSADLSSFVSSSDNVQAGILNSTINPNSASGVLTTPSIFSVNFGDLVGTLTNTFSLAFTKIFGGDSSFNIFFMAVLVFILLVGAFYAYKALRGEPGA